MSLCAYYYEHSTDTLRWWKLVRYVTLNACVCFWRQELIRNPSIGCACGTRFSTLTSTFELDARVACACCSWRNLNINLDLSCVVYIRHAKSGSTALIWAAMHSRNNHECVRLLLEAGADKDARDNVRDHDGVFLLLPTRRRLARAWANIFQQFLVFA